MTAAEDGRGYLLGYARVSTTAQDLARQLDALGQLGIPDDRVWADKRTGATLQRAGLIVLLEYARPGDVVVVYTLDRLGRNLRETLNLIHELRERGIGLRTLADPLPIDTSNESPMGQIAIALLALFAEIERVYANERAAHAREVRRTNGKPAGRPRAHTDKDIDYARLLIEEGSTLRAAAKKAGIPASSLSRYLTAGDNQQTA